MLCAPTLREASPASATVGIRCTRPHAILTSARMRLPSARQAALSRTRSPRPATLTSARTRLPSARQAAVSRPRSPRPATLSPIRTRLPSARQAASLVVHSARGLQVESLHVTLTPVRMELLSARQAAIFPVQHARGQRWRSMQHARGQRLRELRRHAQEQQMVSALISTSARPVKNAFARSGAMIRA